MEEEREGSWERGEGEREGRGKKVEEGREKRGERERERGEGRRWKREEGGRGKKVEEEREERGEGRGEKPGTNSRAAQHFRARNGMETEWAGEGGNQNESKTHHPLRKVRVKSFNKTEGDIFPFNLSCRNLSSDSGTSSSSFGSL